MIIDLDRLEEGRLATRFTVRPEDPLLEGYERAVQEPLDLDVEVSSNAGGIYLVTVEVRGVSRDRCRRCLEQLEIPIEHRFRFVVQTSEDPDEESGDDDVILIGRRKTEVDIGDEVRQRLFLDRTEFSLCTEDCRGICPQCGVDLNESDCDCEVESVDDRWSALNAVRFED